MNWNGMQNGHGLLKKFGLLLSLLVLYTEAFSQADVTTRLTQDFAAYQQQALPEKIYVHTDKNFYVAGEIVWFKIYLVDGNAHKPADLSKVVYVEILDAAQKPVLQAKIEVKQGAGDGSFMLPYSLNSGAFLFRAYTSWMKNFSADYFFQKSITIVNTLKRPDWPSTEPAEKPDVQFFPEGGNLVYGLQSKVAFKAVDQYGKGLACQGVLVADNRDTVARFQTFQFGMGRFDFTPQAGHNYKAFLQFQNGSTATANLPSISTEGYVMTTSEPDTAHLKIAVAVANKPDAYVYLFTHTGQTAHEVLKKLTRLGKAEFILEKKALGEGLSHLTLFDEDRQPLCERLYFKRPLAALPITAKTDQATYKIRSNVTLDIVTTATGKQPASSDLSVSVYLLDSLQRMDPETIQTYLWLTSDLKGRVEAPDYYFQPTKEADEALENLLLTQGWRRFRWNEIAENKKPVFTFLPEYEGLTITGNVVHKGTGRAAANVRTFLSVPGKTFTLVSTTSDSTGRVHFVINKNYGSSEVIVQTEDSTCQVEIRNPFSDRFSDAPFPKFDLSEAWQQALVTRSIGTQAQHAFFKPSQLYHPDADDTTAFYGVPDRKYFLDDYTRFTTMEEILREYVTEVRVRKEADGFEYHVQNIPYKNFFEKPPLLLLDGVPVFNTNQFMAFDPLKLKTLEVTARKYFLDDVTLNGIVSYATYNHDLAGFELPATALVVDYNGLQLKREFYTPVYQTKEQQESRLPDFRNLLAWVPDVKTGRDGAAHYSFYTSDLPGTYVVVVQGLDATGATGSALTTFTVQK